MADRYSFSLVASAQRIVVALIAILIGCMATPVNADDDPFKALRPKTERPYASAKICLLLTDETNRSLGDAAERQKGTTFRVPQFFSEAEPKKLVADLTELFVVRFGDTVRIRSLSELPGQGCNVAVSLDLKLDIGSTAFTSNSVEMSVVVADDKGNPIETLTASGTSGVPWSGWGTSNFKEAWKPALTMLGKGLDESSKLKSYVAGLPKPAETTASALLSSTSPAAIDLAFWDSIKNSKNPSDFQAYLQKFPNGSFADLARIRLTALGEAVPVRLTPLALPADSKLNFGDYHALVIGNNGYKSLTPLKTAVNDAKTVADLLQKEYGFKVTLLLDATRSQTLDAFDELRRTLVENDNLLVYYAGHGYLDADSDRGFWLPVDAEANRRANWLSNSDIADMVRGTRAKHVLLVADSCYAGTLTRSVTVELSALDDFSRLAQKRARTALVSGGLEPVADSGGGGHSVFAKAFLDSLLANTGVVDMSQIFSSMRRQVILAAQQTPQYGDIRQTGHEGGDFIFVRRK